MSYIQLLCGVKEKGDKIKLNLPKNCKKQALFYTVNTQTTI